MREPEGIATPPPGRSSESTWSKHREPDIRIVEVERFESVHLHQKPRSKAGGGITRKLMRSGDRS